jgi:hypothetical protein
VQVGSFDDTPDKLIVDGEVFVGEFVSEADDLRRLIDLGKQCCITP